MKKHILNILFIIILIFVIFDFPFWAYIPIILLGSITPIQKHLKNLQAIKAVNFYCIIPKPFNTLFTKNSKGFIVMIIGGIVIYSLNLNFWSDDPLFNIKLSNYIVACSVVMIIQDLGSRKDWFFETIRIYDQDIKLPGKDSENIPLASITSISRDNRNITLDFKNQPSFSSIIEEGSIRNYDKLIELWRGKTGIN